jgi:hypothetical protein
MGKRQGSRGDGSTVTDSAESRAELVHDIERKLELLAEKNPQGFQSVLDVIDAIAADREPDPIQRLHGDVIGPIGGDHMVGLLVWWADRFAEGVRCQGDAMHTMTLDQISYDSALIVNRLRDIADGDAQPVLGPHFSPPTHTIQGVADAPAEVALEVLAELDKRNDHWSFGRDLLGDPYRSRYPNPLVFEVAMAVKLADEVVSWARQIAYAAAGRPLTVLAKDNMCLKCEKVIDGDDVVEHASTCEW